MEHISDDVLEQYSLKQAVPPEVEEHLLICSTCQDRLEAVDDLVLAMRAAAAQIKEYGSSAE